MPQPPEQARNRSAPPPKPQYQPPQREETPPVPPPGPAAPPGQQRNTTAPPHQTSQRRKTRKRNNDDEMSSKPARGRVRISRRDVGVGTNCGIEVPIRHSEGVWSAFESPILPPDWGWRRGCRISGQNSLTTFKPASTPSVMPPDANPLAIELTLAGCHRREMSPLPIAPVI